MRDFRLTVNGAPRHLFCEPDRPLLRVLREDLGLTGSKEGCAEGHCGTCAVLLDGKVVLACRVPVAEADGKRVVTIEGIGTPDAPHPLQTAYAAAGAIQCGFCTPGMVVRTKALLDENPRPSREEIRSALQPHLCRCTGYQKVFEAVEAAAAVLRGEADPPSLSPPGGPDTLGHAVVPRDALEKATGVTRYAADLPVAGCAYVKVLRSPHHHARLLEVDAAAARACPGVVAVLTAADVEGTNVLKMASDDQPLLCRDVVRFVGDPVAAVVAATEREAEQALAEIRVRYEPLEPVLTAEEALSERVPVHQGRPNAFFRQPIRHGDPEAGFAQADEVVSAAYSTARIEHAYLECDNGFAYVDEAGRLVVVSGSQNIHQHKKTIAGALGLEPADVRVIQPPMGGGFGGKLDVSVGGVLALAAWKTRRPVRLAYTRRETFAATTKRHPFQARVRVGGRKDGTLTALEMDVLADGGAYGSFSKSVLTRGLVHGSGPYRFPNAALLGRAVYTNTAVCGAMRGFGVPQTAFAVESALDELAHRLGVDPLDLRARNAYVRGDVTVCGQKLTDAVGLLECIDALRPRYERARREARGEDAPELRRGVGIACVWFGPGRSAPDQSEAWAELLPDDTLHVRIGSADMGQGLNTAFWQIAARAMGWPLDRVKISTADTETTPDGNFSAGSRQTYVSGRAVQLAVEKLKKAMEDAGARTHADLLSRGLPTLYSVVNKTTTTPLDPADGSGTPWETYDFGIQMAEVAVETRSGKVTVRKVTAVHDLGTVVNRMTLEGQLHGGIAMGLGYALKEEFVYNETDTLAKFRIPRAKDMPEIEVLTVDLPRENGPFGASGAGEFADVPTAPAITNAIFDACGVRVRDLPATPARMRSLLSRP